MRKWASPLSQKQITKLFLPTLGKLIREAGWKVVATGGCFDLLHPGHIRLLEAARKFGGPLIVLVNSDQSIRDLKGADRPLFSEKERLEMLAALSAVDHVCLFSERDPRIALGWLQPDFWIKGCDYAGGDLPERAVVEKYGGKVVILPTLSEHRSTPLLARLRASSETDK